MKKLINKLIGFNILIVILAIVGIFLTINEVTLIIYIGVRATAFLVPFVWIVTIGVFLGGNISLYVKNRKYLPQRPKPAPKPIQEDFDYTNPNHIRSELNRLLTERPLLQSRLEDCLLQMDNIDRKQAKLDEILKRTSEESSLSEVVSTIDEAEKSLCKNLAKVINRAILWDPIEARKAENQIEYQTYRDYIDKYIALNKSILKQSDVLLFETINYIDEKDNGASGEVGLKAMTDAIRSLSKATLEDF
ncbi:MAG: hypothetical protein LBN22_11520 [Clostridiales Family XIII bacterium]|jgi:hypothetical protein|nr:hypothetical protein [Clostridiales Family XIII bacterium]